MGLEVIDKCENCGRGIGKLETAHVRQEHVVCGECHRKISIARVPQSNTNKANFSKEQRIALVFAGICIIVATAYVAVWYSGKVRQDNFEAAELHRIHAYFDELKSTGEYVYNTMLTRSMAAGLGAFMFPLECIFHPSGWLRVGHGRLQLKANGRRLARD